MKALFLDRDGIINVDKGYVYKIDEFQFQDGIFELIKLFEENGYITFIVTNQSGIGRGYYTIEDFEVLTKYMLKEFKKQNIDIVSVEFCPHNPDQNCQCRKPNTGMIDNILSRYNIDLDNSWLFGDKQSDIDLAINSNIGNSVAITQKEIKNASHMFDSVLSAKEFFKENISKIQKKY